MRLRWHCHHFIAQTYVERQIAPQSNIILRIRCDQGLTHSERRRGSFAIALNSQRALVGKKTRERIEAESAIHAAQIQLIVLHPFNEETELQGMLSPGEEGIVTRLKGIPGKGPARLQ